MKKKSPRNARPESRRPGSKPDRGPPRSPQPSRGPAGRAPKPGRGPSPDRGPKPTRTPASDRSPKPARAERGADGGPKPARNFDRRADRGPKPVRERGADGSRTPDRPPPRSERKSPHSPTSFLVEGLSALGEYLRFRPESVTEIYCTDAARRDVERLVTASAVDVEIRALKKPEGAPEYFSPVQARVMVKALDFSELEARIATRERDVIIALDHITDPRNLGAIVRSAAFFGVREVLAPERRQVLFTQASVATAQGGFALTDLVCVVNLSRALRDLKDAGYWIIGTAMDGEPCSALKGVYEKVVLVLGSEDTGLSQKIREGCDRLAAIQGRSNSGSAGGPTLDSLNVSVAAGIFLNELVPSP